MNKVAILGAGIGGLAAAVRLAAAGYKVAVYEQHHTYGGKMGEWSQDGYRWDTGPSLFTMPQYVDELLAMGEDELPFSYEKLSTICHYFWDDGTRMQITEDTEQVAKAFEEKLGEDPDVIQRFLIDSREKYEITNHVFLEKSLHKIRTYLNWGTIKSIFRLPKVQVFSTMSTVNRNWFKNPKTVQFFNRYATYNGSNPYEAPATLNVIPHYEFGFGAYFPHGGIRSIADSVYQKAVELGVDFHLATPAEQIDKQPDGTFLVNRDKSYAIVLSNIDVATAARGPLKNLLSAESQKYEPSSSALIFYWGMDRIFNELDVHNIFFSEDYKKEFNTIFKKQEIDDDPTVYIHISSKIEKSDAPAGGENWFVMVNAPYDENQNWDRMIAEARKDIIRKLSKNLGVGIEPHIVVEHQLTPQLIMTKTGSHKGALYGSSSNNRMSAFLRQPNFSQDHKGLYFCGGSVHPGGGIPLSLLSAKISTDIIKRDFKIH